MRIAFFVAVVTAIFVLVMLRACTELDRVSSELQATKKNLQLVQDNVEYTGTLLTEYKLLVDNLRKSTAQARKDLAELMKNDKESADYGNTAVPDAVLLLLREAGNKNRATTPE